MAAPLARERRPCGHLEHSGAVQIEVRPGALDELVELRWPRSPQRIEPPGQTSLDARDGGPECVGSLPFKQLKAMIGRFSTRFKALSL
jgi:hypothetical protein